MKTAHLIKYSVGGAVPMMMVCFGIDGKMEPGDYVGYSVNSVEEARLLAIKHFATPHNF
ncbi:hypothetical protein QJS83_14920 [Bdellovibrio sp. 22V]|uniref:hypothetical protein n=1 Tax=Bdellovibrio sp. 22V TaxID=3044166 RepID=UPI00254303D3|nr:hypothetical protein [Bdellovibrio sp. 22V]WII71755.1 hypothetical protein QJS83_14920 [Bdellovibrio sp. 22V]